MSFMHLLRGRRLFAAAVVALLVVAACSKSSKKPVSPEPVVPPSADTPANALRLLEWCWDQKSLSAYQSLLDGAFQYVFAAVDTPGVHSPLDRDQELSAADAIFVHGGNGYPAASSVSLTLDPSLVTTSDDRPGKNPVWHKRIDSNMALSVSAAAGGTSTSGTATFYVTRGDSAHLTSDQIAAGAHADSTRWYLDTWIDNSTCPGGKPTCVTVGRIKLDYHPTAAPGRLDP